MKRILVVDDDLIILDVVKLILTAHDFNVYTHPTGLHVPEVVAVYHPDLVLLDINLPGKSGIEICKQLKLIYKIPIILFSADTCQEKALADLCADAFLAKPFDMYDLINIIKFHLDITPVLAA